MGACTSTPPEPELNISMIPFSNTQPQLSVCPAADVQFEDARHTLHPLQTIDDNTLMSKIRDIIDDAHTNNCNKNNNSIINTPYQDLYKALVFKQLNVTQCDRSACAAVKEVKQRLLYILSEIERQDIGDARCGCIDTKIQILDPDDLDLYRHEIDPFTSEQVLRLKETDAYTHIMAQYQTQLQNLLRDKNKDTLFEECSDEKCNLHIDLSTTNDISCQPLKRLEVMLAVYKELKQRQQLWRKVPISDIMSVDRKYGLHQMADDWLHVKIVHIDNDPYKDSSNCMARRLCTRYANNHNWSCSDLKSCAGYQRHYRERTNNKLEQQLYFRPIAQSPRNKTQHIMNDKDVVFQQECDKIHSFLLHSTIKWGTGINPIEKTASAEEQTMKISKHSKGRSYSKSKPKNESIKDEEAQSTYVGVKEDEEWWRNIDNIHIHLTQKGVNTSINEGFAELVSKMGIFRYQSAHGFRCGQNRGLHHLKPRFQNVKEEVLYNDYHQLSVTSWNQTLRKSKVFFNSWARRKIKSLNGGMYEDQITGKTTKWCANTEIQLQEIITFKLYTDYDQLQKHLKRCFRWETIADADADETSNCVKRSWSKHELEERLTQFFHWRSSLLVVLNKYGQKIGHKGRNLILYHGVNAKMILNPTECMAFYGPLSTTSSLHVAKTFATNKGMILKLTTNYPRTGICKAFDASVISDYPEEQEWLIGFVYLRVLEVQTISIDIYNDDEGWNYNHGVNCNWDPSLVRSIFFAINLFRQQMFSMSEHLQYHLQVFLQQILPLSYDRYDDRLRQNVKYLKDVIDNKPEARKHTSRKRKILKILWEKFDEFRQLPNLKQIIKFDKISDGLKAYFLDESTRKDIHKQRIIWDVSFDKITTLFPNVQEIHFFNEYMFNDEILKRLIQQIRKHDNKLKIIKFVYREYEHEPTESKYFYPPDRLNKILMDQLTQNGRWKYIVKDMKVGFKIRLEAVSDPLMIASEQTRKQSLSSQQTQ